nr:UPF0262 family protein [Pararhodospirillum oryzae]
MPDPALKPTDRLVGITLDERTFVRRRPEVEHERAVAIFDLLEDNRFAVVGLDGPYRLALSLEDNRLVFDVRDEADLPLTRFVLGMASFRSVVKDYFTVCESYYTAIRTLSPSQIEAIDMGRRGLHNEGATLLRERLAGHAVLDHDTSRRLFTLLCVLHVRA